MSVIIHGLDMPQGETAYVELQVWGDGKVYKRRGLAGKLEQIGTAVPLPEGHGRLGDLDALEKELAFDYAYASAKVCHNAPTIIPAEGGTDDV